MHALLTRAMHIHMMTCSIAWKVGGVPTVQIRDLDDEVYAALARRAAEEGISVPELLRQHAARLAARPSISEWLERTKRRSSEITRQEVLDSLDEMRGSWPDAGR